jgi:uncharacterized membrane protein YtjA (UPF0391 family)
VVTDKRIGGRCPAMGRTADGMCGGDARAWRHGVPDALYRRGSHPVMPVMCNQALREHRTLKGNIMLKWALIFALIAVVAGLLGFTGVAAGAASIAKLLFGIFLVLALVVLLLAVLGVKAFSR